MKRKFLRSAGVVALSTAALLALPSVSKGQSPPPMGGGFTGETHAFTLNFGKPVDYLGHHMVYDENATEDAQKRADAFIAAHMK